ncbi:hypothetical protein CLHOM_11740 [Clostridium homopropionicum DSM 5847]|uniref:DUF4179 domain-containing protein n=1 Tax=Clostridium homopropionicum DSM 5847 TaxID=1121318 RepID=A0A0L6ZBL2_9CLOT|nr:DUF4179 domain-containing protein [Clostridium homopropionicum]KOA20355.1 hypothetical protein CLHOM_11740 [Clostridium homopropionicum DSM 5847]SFG73952.1 protein of unknown function [Clostridium homopropionicum]
MSEVEKILNNKRIEIDNLKVPEELERRLRNSLENLQPKKKSKFNWKVKIASIIIASIFLGYNMDTLAFYGKRLMGYDGVMNGTLKKLNEAGKGQIIDKSYTFKNGVKVTLDGVMLDDNQLLLFYTINSPKGDVDKVDLGAITSIEGIGGSHYMKSGQGESNEERTEIKWKSEFEKPYFFEKKLKWSFNLKEGNNLETGEITFNLDKDKAMGHSLKKSINKSIKIDQGEISFKSIVASPTSTRIDGTVQNIFQLAMDEIKGEGFRTTGIEIKLIANGKEVEEQSGGTSTSYNGITFNRKYDALPQNLKTLEIKLVNLGTNNTVDEEIELKDKEKDKIIKVLEKEIVINDINEQSGNTLVTITTEEDVILSKVYMMIDGKKVELDKTTSTNHDKKLNGTIIHTRTLDFKGTGKDKKLVIKGIMYNKEYNQVIEIPVD